MDLQTCSSPLSSSFLAMTGYHSLRSSRFLSHLALKGPYSIQSSSQFLFQVKWWQPRTMKVLKWPPFTHNRRRVALAIVVHIHQGCPSNLLRDEARALYSPPDIGTGFIKSLWVIDWTLLCYCGLVKELHGLVFVEMFLWGSGLLVWYGLYINPKETTTKN